MTTPALLETAQSPEPGPFIVLYELDLNALGGGVHRFTSSAEETQAVVFAGNAYPPVPVEASGFEWAGRGPMPTPRLRVANVNRVFSALVIEYGDLVGATFRRLRTFRKFLDGQPTADPNAMFPPDIYRVERKVTQNKMFVEWELSAAMDQEGRMLPGRLCLRDTCTHRYRTWNGSAFDYTKATCPYTGAAYFTETGEVTLVPAEDRCSKMLSGCRARFGETAVLPTRAFPGIARVRR